MKLSFKTIAEIQLQNRLINRKKYRKLTYKEEKYKKEKANPRANTRYKQRKAQEKFKFLLTEQKELFKNE